MVIHTEAPPLRVDEGGGIRVGNSRLTLDCLIYAFKEGAGAEEIALRYDAVDLASIYSALAYYLRHKEELEAYLKRREEEADRIHAEIRANPNTRAVRERLLARLSRKA